MLVAGWQAAGYGVDQLDKNRDGKGIGRPQFGPEKNTAA